MNRHTRIVGRIASRRCILAKLNQTTFLAAYQHCTTRILSMNKNKRHQNHQLHIRVDFDRLRIASELRHRKGRTLRAVPYLVER